MCDNTSLEIERKFLLTSCTPLLNIFKWVRLNFKTNDIKIESIKQYYLSDSERVRKTVQIFGDDKTFYEICIKDITDNDIVRKETEESISPEAFYNIIKGVDRFVYKERISWHSGGLLYSVDKFRKPKMSSMLEVEFPNKNEADVFNPSTFSEFLEREVTSDPHFYNNYLSRLP